MAVVAITAFGLELVEWALVVGAAVFALEMSGLSRSGRTARKDNADLRERVVTLEGEKLTLEERSASLQRQVDELVKTVDDLRSRNVDALWSAFSDHDRRVSEGHERMIENLSALAVNIASHEDQVQARYNGMLVLMERIADKVDREVT